MNNISTMFLNEISVVDHAYWTEVGTIRGGSFNPSFTVKGEVDPIENVVVDFSTIKKQMKNAIDDKSLGFDHKLWVIEGLSDCVVFINDHPVTDFNDLLTHNVYDELTPVRIVSSSTDVTVPKNAVKFIRPPEGLHEYTLSNVGVWFENFLNGWFKNVVQFKCYNTINAHTLYPQSSNPIGYFTYAHGLKDSTSWGCQNLAHGHLSFIQLESDSDPSIQQEIVHMIAAELDNTVFINTENVVNLNDDSVSIEYTTPRGRFAGKYPLQDHNLIPSVTPASPFKCVVLETETTIEFLVEYINASFSDILDRYGVTRVFVSEGLSKGAVAP